MLAPRGQNPGRSNRVLSIGISGKAICRANIETAEEAGYELFNTYTVPKKTWVKDCYDILEPRAKSLLNHSNVAVRDFAIETLKEIETFKIAEDSYGYVFYILQRSN